MIQLSIAVRMEDWDEPKTFTVTPKVQVDFERKYATSIVAAFADMPKMEHLYWLGWASMKQAGEVVKLFDGWLEQVVEVRPEEDPTGDDPT